MGGHGIGRVIPHCVLMNEIGIGCGQSSRYSEIYKRNETCVLLYYENKWNQRSVSRLWYSY